MTAYSEWYDNPGGYTATFINELYGREPKYLNLIESEAVKAANEAGITPGFSYSPPISVINELPKVPMGEVTGGMVDETALSQFVYRVVEKIREMNS